MSMSLVWLFSNCSLFDILHLSEFTLYISALSVNLRYSIFLFLLNMGGKECKLPVFLLRLFSLMS